MMSFFIRFISRQPAEKIFLFVFCIFLMTTGRSHSQDRNYALNLVDTFGSSYMAGRGYVDGGDQKAAKLIASEFSKHKLKPLGRTYFQKLNFPMNTFPGKVVLKAEDVTLEAGTDFIINSSANSVKGNFKLVYLMDSLLTLDKLIEKALLEDNKGKILVVSKYFDALHYEQLPNIKGIMVLSKNNLTWSVSPGRRTQDFIVIESRLEKFPQYANSIDIEVENIFIKKHNALNVAGFVEGAVKPDSFIVFVAHYDHLGKLGEKVWFPGANDNASGTAMMIDLARHYGNSAKPPDYSIAFIAFAGEEAGLSGSTYFSEHPLIKLKNIRFVINLDMMGTGIDGIKVVNGSIFKREFEVLCKINKEKSYIKDVSMRGESKNSDHYPFYKNGVPAFFIYSLDENYKDYHNLGDRPDKLPMTAYDGIFKLMTDFVGSFSGN